MDFREILGTSSRRRLVLVESLYHEPEGLASNQLLEILDCSLPILLNDIKLLNNNQEYFQIEKFQGLYRLQIHPQISIAKLYSDTIVKSPEFQILEQLLYEKCENITMLAEQLFLSDSNTQRYLKKIENTLKDAKIKLKYRPLRLEGNESVIRHLYYRYFYEKEMGNGLFLPQLKGFQLRSIEALVIDFIQRNGFYQLYIFQKRLIYNVYIGLWRVKNGHHLTAEKINQAWFELPQKYILNEFGQTVKEIYQLHLTDELLKECFWSQYANEIVFSSEQLTLALKQPDYRQLFIQHKELVMGFEQLLGKRMEKEKHDVLVATLMNDVAFYPKKGDFVMILRRSRFDFLKTIRHMHSQILAKIEQLVNDFTDRYQMYQTADFIGNYMYLLITSIPNCIEQIANHTPKVNLLLVSDLSPTEDTYLKDQITRRIYGNFEISHLTLFQEGQRGIIREIEQYDGLITTSSMQGLALDFPTVIIEPFLNHLTLYEIQQLVSELAAKKEVVKQTADK